MFFDVPSLNDRRESVFKTSPLVGILCRLLCQCGRHRLRFSPQRYVPSPLFCTESIGIVVCYCYIVSLSVNINACCIAFYLVLSADCILYCRRSYPLICIKTAKIIINRIPGPEILIKNGGV
mgnify:CR=1 FL=1